MQEKVDYIRPKVVRHSDPSTDPAQAGSYMHRAALLTVSKPHALRNKVNILENSIFKKSKQQYNPSGKCFIFYITDSDIGGTIRTQGTLSHVGAAE
jgi:hypothetical protein